MSSHESDLPVAGRHPHPEGQIFPLKLTPCCQSKMAAGFSTGRALFIDRFKFTKQEHDM